MSVATMSVEQMALAQEAQATIEKEGIRRVGHVEAARALFVDVNGTGRTDKGIALGKVLSDSLSEERSVDKKRKWLAEIAKQICGSYSDDGKLVEYIKLYHVTLRVPCLKQLGLTWALKAVGSMKAGFDWKAVTDAMSAVQIDRAQHIMPMLVEGTDGIGCDAKTGKPSRKLWAQIISYYLEHGEMPAVEETTASTGSDATSTTSTAETVTPTVPAVEPLNLETVAKWLNSQNHENLIGMADLLSQETMERLYDCMETIATRRTATPTTASTDKAIAA